MISLQMNSQRFKWQRHHVNTLPLIWRLLEMQPQRWSKVTVTIYCNCWGQLSSVIDIPAPKRPRGRPRKRRRVVSQRALDDLEENEDIMVMVTGTEQGKYYCHLHCHDHCDPHSRSSLSRTEAQQHVLHSKENTGRNIWRALKYCSSIEPMFIGEQ